jgi:hypothetical protein
MSWSRRGDNVTKAGQRYDNQYCMVWRIEDGKIKEIKEYCDWRWSSACQDRFRAQVGGTVRRYTASAPATATTADGGRGTCAVRRLPASAVL